MESTESGQSTMERGEQQADGQQGLYRSPSALEDRARAEICESLNDRLADGLDLLSQIKEAHWNVKGPLFAALHPLFDKFASKLGKRNDEIAERAVTLGGRARGTLRQALERSQIPEYPAEVTRDLEHVRLLLDRFEAHLAGLRETRELADNRGDDDTVDLLTGVIKQFEKYAWFLCATLERA